MQIISSKIDRPINEYPLIDAADPDKALYFDIETTGLMAENNRIYLIGCAYRTASGWKMTQWFDETGNEEKDILSSFMIFSHSYPVWLHYNGDRFDLPFLIKRLEANNLDSPVESVKSVDLYKIVKTYSGILNLPDYKQQTVEAFMETGRTDATDGKELIALYNEYITDHDEEKLSALLSHNEADIAGLIGITGIIALKDLCSSSLSVFRAQANYYNGLDGKTKQELIISARARNLPEGAIKKRIVTSKDNCYLNIEDDKVTLRVPMVEGELKYFYANYKDYYYLPSQDQALHKSIASFVDKAHREQAKAENCYTRKSGTFLPEWSDFRTPFFKKAYKDDYAWFELTADMKKDKQFFCKYADYVFSHVIRSCLKETKEM